MRNETLVALTSPAAAWDGYDYESGNYVEIEEGQLVRPGREIEYVDYDKGEYRYCDVESIRDSCRWLSVSA